MMNVILLLPFLELCYVYFFSFQTMWLADWLTPDLFSSPCHYLLGNLFKVNILRVLFHLFMHMTAISWALNISAKHVPGNTAVRKISKVPAMVHVGSRKGDCK